MLTVNQLTIKTLKDRILIDHLSFTCVAGDKIAVIGEEGNGKSTLFKAIWNPDLISEYTVMEGTIDRRGAVIGYLPQSLDARWVETSGLDFCMSETPSEIPDYEKIGEERYARTWNLLQGYAGYQKSCTPSDHSTI